MPPTTKRRSRPSSQNRSSSSPFKPRSRKYRNHPNTDINIPLHSKKDKRTTHDSPPLVERLNTFKNDFMTELKSSIQRDFNEKKGPRKCSMPSHTKSKRKSSGNSNLTHNESKPASKQLESSSPKAKSRKKKTEKPENSPRTHAGKRIPSMRAFVPRHILEGGTAPPFRRSLFTRLVNSLHPNTAIRVEALQGGLSASVLYAPEYTRGQPPFIPTTLVSSSPRKSDSRLVYRDSPYEIRVAGMSVRNYDRWGPNGDNELLMYSVQTDPTTTASDGQSLPYIHFDFKRDGCSRSEKPNTYVPIPASKSYVMGSSLYAPKKLSTMLQTKTTANGVTKLKQNGTAKPNTKEAAKATTNVGKKVPPKLKSPTKKSVNVQFRILELDEPNEMVRSAVKGIDQLGGIIAGFSSVAPMLGVLSPALGLASSVSKHALDSYASPDKVISIDMDFLLADRNRVRNGTATSGEYLRYGYYFFLSEPVEGRLYASVKTAKNLQLMLHQLDGNGRRFFPLTDVSYLVVRVVEPTDAAKFNRRPILMNHATQLENIFQQSSSVDDPEQLRKAITSLGKELGVIPEDD